MNRRTFVKGITIGAVGLTFGVTPTSAAGGDLEWSKTIQLGTYAELFHSSTIVDGTVYVPAYESSNSTVFALDAATGSEEWSTLVGGDPHEVTVVDGVAYVGDDSGTLRALDAATGNQNWSFSAGDGINTATTVMDGMVFVGARDNNLYAVDTETGTEEWIYTTGGSIRSSPTVVDGVVYFGSQDNNLYAVDAATGTEEWSYSVGDTVNSSPTVFDGVVYVGSVGNSLHAVDVATGTQKWTFTTGGAIYSSPTVADGTVFFGSYDNNLYAVDAETGNEEWSYATGNSIGYSSPTVASGTVYVGSQGGSMHAVDAASGSQEWTFSVGVEIATSPTVANGTVFFASSEYQDKTIYAVDTGHSESSEGTRVLYGTLGHHNTRLLTDIGMDLVSGTVEDYDGNPVSGATVSIDGVSAETDGGGYYEIRLSEGEYVITVEADGYTDKSKTVNVTGDMTVDFTLEYIGDQLLYNPETLVTNHHSGKPGRIDGTSRSRIGSDRDISGKLRITIKEE